MPFRLLGLPRLPRPIYWMIGAAIAFSGAIAARNLAEKLSENDRFLAWLAGGAVIFLGVAILSLGTRYRLDEEPPPDDDAKLLAEGDGAGEGNRTLA